MFQSRPVFFRGVAYREIVAVDFVRAVAPIIAVETAIGAVFGREGLAIAQTAAIRTFLSNGAAELLAVIRPFGPWMNAEELRCHGWLLKDREETGLTLP